MQVPPPKPLGSVAPTDGTRGVASRMRARGGTYRIYPPVLAGVCIPCLLILFSYIISTTAAEAVKIASFFTMQTAGLGLAAAT